jgi:phage FluMu protein Com
MGSPLKALSAILFSLGSVFLVVELFVKVVIDERSFSEAVLPTNWTAIGLLGLLGWIIGIVLLVYLKLSAPSLKSDKKNIFLAGKRSFRCLNCGKTIDASRVGYMKRIDCPCGAIYNVFQETEWEREP